MAPVEKTNSDSKEDKPEEVPEDTPVVKALKEADDRYLVLERECKKEIKELEKKFTEKQKPFLEQRRDILAKSEDSAKTGTPALKGFWLQAMQNHPAFEDEIMEWDEAVLEYLEDVEKTDMEGDDSFKITFKFKENPYFAHTELVKEYQAEETNPYCGEIEAKKITATEIEWKSGMDVTVEKVVKKQKGSAKKKTKDGARPSFFRSFFRTLEPGMDLTKDLLEHARSLQDEEDDELDDEDTEDIISTLMENDYQIGTALRDNIIPFAVRWYTGEAAPDDMDDDEEEESEDDESEDEDDSEDDAPRGKGKGKGKGAKKKTSPKSSPELKPAGQPKEECKQQ